MPDSLSLCGDVDVCGCGGVGSDEAWALEQEKAQAYLVHTHMHIE
jgi:hypothetical protein